VVAVAVAAVVDVVAEADAGDKRKKL